MPDRRRFERTPDTIALLGALAVGGALLTIFGVVPGSVAAIASTVYGVTWSAALTIGATVSLAGVLTSRADRGWVLEAAGRACLAPILLGYSLALGGAATSAGTWFLVVLFAALSAGSAYRAYQSVRRLGEFRAALRRGVSGD